MIELKQKLLEKKLCDHCLGRQFSLLYMGFLPAKIGAAIRKAENESQINELLKQELEILEFEDCWLCANTFSQTKEFEKKLIAKSKELEFETFLIGNHIPQSVLEKEDSLWSEISCESCEPIKREVNRIFGVFLEKELKQTVEFNNPDVVFLIDYINNKIDTQINSLYIYGNYNKLERGLPQTKWPCRMCSGTGEYKKIECSSCKGSGKQFKETVEELIAVKALEKTQAMGESMHGSGREDRDALMLGNGRPFVLELKEPKKRFIDFQELENEINEFCNGKVKVNSLRKSNKQEVIEIKKAEHDKLYECTVKCESPYKELNKLDEFFVNKELSQRTPTRVAHRRKDKVRKRVVLSVKTQPIDELTFKVTIKAASGTYIKELISGDFTRTKPSFTEILGVPCVCEQLDVLEVIEL